MPGGEVGIVYTATFSASGGPTPYKWSLDSGALPPGLTLGSDGSVSGAPSAAGTFTFTVRASDSQNQYTTQGATIKVAPHLAAALIATCAQHCSVEQGCVNVCGNFGTQSGGVGPFSYSATGNIPGGMKLSGLSLAGSFPNVAQFWQFNVTITDSLGAVASIVPTFLVYKHITFGGGSIPGCSWLGCTVTFPYSGGTPGGKVAASVKIATYSQTCLAGANCPPPIHTVSATAANGTVTIKVTNSALGASNPAWLSNGWFGTLSLVLTDSSPCGSGNCTTGQQSIPIVVQAG